MRNITIDQLIAFALGMIFTIVLISLSACAQAPAYPGGYYPAQSPSQQMLSVGQTLIRADQPPHRGRR